MSREMYPCSDNLYTEIHVIMFIVAQLSRQKSKIFIMN